MGNPKPGVLSTGIKAIEQYNAYAQSKSIEKKGATSVSKQRLVVVTKGDTQEIQCWDMKNVGLIDRLKAFIGWGCSYRLRNVAIVVGNKTAEITPENVKTYEVFITNLAAYNQLKGVSGIARYFHNPVSPASIEAIACAIDKVEAEAALKKAKEQLKTPETEDEERFKESYYRFVDQAFPSIDGLFATLKMLRAEEQNAISLRVLREEVEGIEGMLARKSEEVGSLVNEYPAFRGEVCLLEKWLTSAKVELAAFKRELREKESEFQIYVPGIQNAGNSCYMNSALQGLFVSSVVVGKIKEYNKDPVPEKERFMPILKELLGAYERYNRTASPEDTRSISRLAATLRYELYQTRLKDLGVERINAMADADLVAMVLGEVLKVEYTLVTRTQGVSGEETIVSDGPSVQLIWPEIKTSGSPSLQEVFNQQCAGFEGPSGWRTQTQSGRKVTLDNTTASYRIQGEPPPLLVFRVGSSGGELMDSAFTPYKITAKDEIFDASKAFDIPPNGGAKYRLISVLENHGRYHWTAKSRHEDGWYDCNDSVVRKIGQEVPQTGGAVMIYERINSALT